MICIHPRTDRPLYVRPVRLGFPIAVWLNFIAAICVADRVAASTGDLDFARDVRPILSETCFHCHGPDEEGRAAGLRLDIAENATEDLGGYAAIVAGDRNDSEAWLRMISDDPDMVMPPPDSHLSITDDQREILGRWIDEGAHYADHWAFVAPRRTGDAQSGSQTIDRFVRESLETNGLVPSPEADPAVLIRRLTFDLHGLPPTPAEVDRFVSDYRRRGEPAYVDAVDRLLNSRRFGERMAVPWMDAARYADTNGYSIDGGRDMWLFRDWVIESINRNQPIDEFITHQLAGDLLPDADDASRIASGFNRNHMITHEGGTIPEENLTNYVVDRVKTTAEVFLGLTVGCAQCHDHKYDPISQEDYYRFFAFFNEIDDRGIDGNGGINATPSISVRTVLPDDEIDSLRRRESELVRTLARRGPAFDDWVKQTVASEQRRGRGFETVVADLVDVNTPNRTGPYAFDDGWVTFEKPSGSLTAMSHRLRFPGGRKLTGLRIELVPHRGADAQTADPPRLTPHDLGVPQVTTVLASAGTRVSTQVDLYNEVTFGRASANSFTADGNPTNVLDQRNVGAWRPADAARPARLTLTFDTPIDTTADPEMAVMVFFGRRDSLPFRYRIVGFVGTDPDTAIPSDVAAILDLPRRDWTESDTAKVHRQYIATAAAAEPARIELTNVRERIGVLTRPASTMVMNQASEPRQTFILNRGQYDAPGDPVSPGTPSALPSIAALLPDQVGEDERLDRLDLARWLTAKDHPLTGRVVANRIWSLFFGRGLVATEADFGSQGAYPTHPELLDHLAITLVESGWDRKDLIRRIVRSETYRQSSHSTTEPERTADQPHPAEIDPDNLWLWHGPRFRLPAEFIRDSALAYAGLLVDRIGGPSVLPYQPPGLWKEVSHFGSTPATRQVFVQDRGEKLYRRSLYTFVKRTSPHPSMAALDAPNRESCVIRRETTNTPVQALVTLNDPQFAEAARCLAGRMLDAADDDQRRLAFGFQTVLSRDALPAERDRFLEHVKRMRSRYDADPAAAAQIASIGESPSDEDHDAFLTAAWTSVATVLMNTSEAMTRP